MSVLTAVVLGLVQGIAEFLPISSSGHLAIAEHLLSIQGASNVPDFFDVLLHLGTLVAVFAAYWDDIRDMIVEFFAGIGDLAHHRMPNPVPPARRLILLIIVGTLPLFVMVPFRRFFTELSDNMYFIGGRTDRHGHPALRERPRAPWPQNGKDRHNARRAACRYRSGHRAVPGHLPLRHDDHGGLLHGL